MEAAQLKALKGESWRFKQMYAGLSLDYKLAEDIIKKEL